MKKIGARDLEEKAKGLEWSKKNSRHKKNTVKQNVEASH
jgi:hypothetical protein